jgi:hypothetical protein
MEITTPSQIEKMIYVIRGQKVMLDSDLAVLYEIPTKRLNEQVKRNLDRFPPDFMFQLNEKEFDEFSSLVSEDNEQWGGRRKLPLVFTECGVAMLSSVLSSQRAITINIAIMRTFVRLRSFLVLESTLSDRVGKLEKNTSQLFKIVFERLNSLEEGLPDHPKDRKKIGLTSDND